MKSNPKEEAVQFSSPRCKQQSNSRPESTREIRSKHNPARSTIAAVANPPLHHDSSTEPIALGARIRPPDLDKPDQSGPTPSRGTNARRHLLGRLRHSGDTLKRGPRETAVGGTFCHAGVKMWRRESKTAIAERNENRLGFACGRVAMLCIADKPEADQQAAIRYGSATMTPWSRADRYGACDYLHLHVISSPPSVTSRLSLVVMPVGCASPFRAGPGSTSVLFPRRRGRSSENGLRPPPENPSSNLRP